MTVKQAAEKWGLSELKQQIIRNRWHTIELEKVVDNIHNRQQP